MIKYKITQKKNIGTDLFPEQNFFHMQKGKCFTKKTIKLYFFCYFKTN